MMDILEGLGGAFVKLLMGLVSLPVFPPEVAQYLAVVIEWMSAGMGIIDFFCPLDAIAPAIVLFIAISAMHKIYYIVMWVLKKIPGISVR